YVLLVVLLKPRGPADDDRSRLERWSDGLNALACALGPRGRWWAGWLAIVLSLLWVFLFLFCDDGSCAYLAARPLRVAFGSLGALTGLWLLWPRQEAAPRGADQPAAPIAADLDALRMLGRALWLLVLTTLAGELLYYAPVWFPDWLSYRNY